jgi:hypothetical protein
MQAMASQVARAEPALSFQVWKRESLKGSDHSNRPSTTPARLSVESDLLFSRVKPIPARQVHENTEPHHAPRANTTTTHRSTLLGPLLPFVSSV